jgi:succinate-acetate transporter protein
MAEATRLANPAPLGLAAFGMTTVLLSLINASVLPHSGDNVVIPLALAYGGAVQIMAGLLEFRLGKHLRRDSISQLRSILVVVRAHAHIRRGRPAAN